jgi:uncharacterized protein
VEVWAQPGASCDAVVGLHDGALKVAVSVPPVSGQANRRIMVLLAGYFGVARRSVLLHSGRVLRRKYFLVEGPRKQQGVCEHFRMKDEGEVGLLNNE